MIDIGANLTDSAFSRDFDSVIERAKNNNISHIIITGTSVQESRKALNLASNNPDYLSATVGVHPHAADLTDTSWLDDLRVIAQESNAVALGEMGLDYYRNYVSKENQLKVFRKQLGLAQDVGLPVFIHDRDSGYDVLNLLKEYKTEQCVIHCFTGKKELLDAYLAEGYYIGITGWVCDDRRGKELSKLLPIIPLERLMIETDSPYLIPRTIRPRPKSRRNEPAFLKFVAQKVAQCHGVTIKEVTQKTSQNAVDFFRLGNRKIST